MLAIAGSVQVNADMPLADAMVILRQTMGLHDWANVWALLRPADWEVCGFQNELNRYFLPAFYAIQSDPLYQQMRDRMIAGNVEWDSFIDEEFKPALGYYGGVGPCTTNELGGVERLRNELRGLMHQELVENTIADLRQQSSAFNDLHLSIEANQAGITRMRCHEDVQLVFFIASAYSVDLDVILGFVFGVFMGWDPLQNC